MKTCPEKFRFRLSSELYASQTKKLVIIMPFRVWIENIFPSYFS